MTVRKDNLPEYEPRDDSWKQLEASLRLEDQLRRTIKELPRHQPRSQSWEHIAHQLDAPPRPVFRYFSIAAAAVFVLLAGMFLLLKKEPPEQEAVAQFAQKRTPATSHPPEAVGNTGKASAPKEIRDNQKVAHANGKDHKIHPDLTAGAPLAVRKIRTAPAHPAEEHSPELRHQAADSSIRAIPVQLAKRRDSILHQVSLTASADEKPLARITSASTRRNGRHRVIHIQWEKPKKQVTLAGLPTGTNRPAASPQAGENNRSNLIIIKL